MHPFLKEKNCTSTKTWFELCLQSMFAFVSLVSATRSPATTINFHISHLIKLYIVVYLYFICFLHELPCAAPSLSFDFVLIVVITIVTYPQSLFLTHPSPSGPHVLSVLNTALYIIFLLCLKLFLFIFLPKLWYEIAVLYWFRCSQITSSHILDCRNLLFTTSLHQEPWKTGKWGHWV